MGVTLPLCDEHCVATELIELRMSIVASLCFVSWLLASHIERDWLM